MIQHIFAWSRPLTKAQKAVLLKTMYSLHWFFGYYRYFIGHSAAGEGLVPEAI